MLAFVYTTCLNMLVNFSAYKYNIRFTIIIYLIFQFLKA